MRVVPFARAAALLLALVSPFACKKKEPGHAPPAPPAPARPQPASAKAGAPTILYGKVARTRAAPPARFAAPLPLPHEFPRFGADRRFPPPTHVADLLAAGDAEMHARLLVALREAVRRGASAEALRKSWGGLLRFRDDPPLCAVAARQAVGAEPAPIRAFFWQLLPECDGPEVAALFQRADAPGEALLARAGTFGAKPPPYAPAIGEAAERIIRTGGLEARRAAMALAEFGDARVLALLLSLHARVTDPRIRHDVAMALGKSADPRARAIAGRACADRPDPMCGPSGTPAGKVARPAAALEHLAIKDDINVAETIGDRRGPEVVAALDACVRRNPEPFIRRSCLEQLATRDRPRAAAALSALSPADEDPWLRALAATLARFPDAAGLEAHLRAAGIDVSAAGSRRRGEEDDRAPLVARDYLERARRLHHFDVETGQFPNEHDSLLRDLAAIAGARFPRVLFEEIAPGAEKRVTFDNQDDESADGPYTLVAYVAGERLTMTAENHGDWYDVEAVLGLLNVIARDARVDTRFVSLATTDQTASIVALPEATIISLANAGLLSFDAPDEARELGRAYEQQVFRQMGGR